MNLKKVIISGLFAYIYLILFLVVPLDFNATLPNDISLVSSDIILDGVEQNNSIYSVSVISMPYVTPFSLIFYQNNDQVTVNQNTVYDTIFTLGEQLRQAQISKEASVELSLIHSFMMAHNQKSEIFIDYEFTGLRVYSRHPIFTQLEIDDLITSINGVNESYQAMINEFVVSNNLELTINRGNQVIQTTLVKENNNYFYFYPKYNITNSNPTFSLPVLSRLVGGPSAGAMQTLSLYIDLLEIKVDQRMVGTGTIEYDGKVGLIGGLRQKVYTAIRENVNYFFLPAAMIDEVSDLSNQITLIPIETINQAVEAINEIFN